MSLATTIYTRIEIFFTYFNWLTDWRISESYEIDLAFWGTTIHWVRWLFLFHG